MLSLNQVIAGAKVRGLAGASPVEIVRTEWIGSERYKKVLFNLDYFSKVTIAGDFEFGLLQFRTINIANNIKISTKLYLKCQTLLFV